MRKTLHLFLVLGLLLFLAGQAAASVATITVTTVSRSGVDFTSGSQAATGGGDFWAGTGAEFLVINNGGGSPITVTLTYTATTDGQSITARTVSVTNGHIAIIGPFPTSLYNDSTGNVGVTYSAVTSVKVLVYKLGN